MKHALILLTSFLLASCGGGGGNATIDAGTTSIEFVLDVQNDPVSHLERLNVLPLAGRPVGCLVMRSGTCTSPASVQLWLDSPFGSEAGEQIIGPHPPNYGVVAGSLDTGTHIFKAAVIAPPDANGFSLRREGYVTFNIFGPAQAGFTGEAPPLNSSLTISDPAIGGTRGVRSPVTFSAANSGASTVNSSSVRFVLKPEGSGATISYDGRAQTGVFVPDRAGRYAIEYTPTLQDGRAGLPTYAIVSVAPNTTSVIVRQERSDLNSDRPPPPPNSTRVAVFGNFNSFYGFASVEAFVDDASLGRLTQTNAQLPGLGASGESIAAYAFDVPNANIASGTHTLTVVVVDLVGVPHTMTMPIQPVVSGDPLTKAFTFTDTGT